MNRALPNVHYRLALISDSPYVLRVKSANVQEVPRQWSEILRWVAAGEEVQVMEQDKVVARVTPVASVPTPDFLARAKAVWGENPPGETLSGIVAAGRGKAS